MLAKRLMVHLYGAAMNKAQVGQGQQGQGRATGAGPVCQGGSVVSRGKEAWPAKGRPGGQSQGWPQSLVLQMCF